MPFAACPQRCLFCAQELQSGRQARDVELFLAQAEQDPAWARARGKKNAELAFFGGTFTALPEADLSACLGFARRWIERGLFASFRCSTRPDAVNLELLERLRRSGCSTVELGVQSFDGKVLAASRRGYDAKTAREACAMVREAGLGLGVQLMPGMPGLDPEGAWGDVLACREIAPDCVRLYPCLVIEGTELADRWRKGLFSPWELETALDFLARACPLLEDAGIAVIRMGLAEEPGLADKVLAGPRHPEMGNMVRGLALLAYIGERLGAWREEAEKGAGRMAKNEKARLRLLVPRGVQGMFWGHGGALEGAYAALGLERGRVFFEDRRDFLLCVAE